MKTIGLIGGMSWESSIEYYRIINEEVKSRLGKLHSADSLMYSVDFAPVEELQRQGKWEKLTEIMIHAARRLERGGAELLVICTNTMHRMADEVQASIGIPLLHVVDAAADSVKKGGLKTVGLLGTRFTMEQDFYRGRLEKKHGLQVAVPESADRERVHRVIYDELVAGELRQESKAAFLRIIDKLVSRGAQGIILGCTEIPLLVKDGDCPVPVFDTTRLHARAAVDLALAQ
ncbi:MAG TPA: aspartate/glutamate racemase family protein [Spirochaetia bacterium]|nr:aspartate/glutamate racemase family protein [Spirochaetia bacterium]